MPAMIRIANLLLLALAALGVGCESLPTVPPPVVKLTAHSIDDPRRWFGGQGIAVDNRVITAAHLITKSSGPHIPTSLGINGRILPIHSPIHGDLRTVTALYQSGKMTGPDALAQDWFCFQAEPRTQLTSRTISFNASAPVPGERLFAVRIDPAADADTYSYRPLTVVAADFENTPMPDRIVTVRIKNDEQLPGWSGCFVGRYVPTKTPPWQFVGILIGEVELEQNSACILVIRPPDDAIAWLRGARTE